MFSELEIDRDSFFTFRSYTSSDCHVAQTVNVKVRYLEVAERNTDRSSAAAALWTGLHKVSWIRLTCVGSRAPVGGVIASRPICRPQSVVSVLPVERVVSGSAL